MTEFFFTSDDEINEFQPEERAVNITGYVSSIDGLRVLRTPQGHVFKFVLNNNEHTKIKVLIWGTNLTRQWEAQINMYSVIEIIGGTVRVSNARYRDPDVHLLEFHVQPTSTIAILGTFNPEAATPAEVIYRPILLQNVMFVQGPVEIDCFVRITFRVVQYNLSVCGQAHVTDGYYRLTANVAAFATNEFLTVGKAIRIRGEMNRETGVFTIVNMNDVEIREGVDALTMVQVRQGFHPVIARRLRPNEIGEILEDIIIGGAGANAGHPGRVENVGGGAADVAHPDQANGGIPDANAGQIVNPDLVDNNGN